MPKINLTGGSSPYRDILQSSQKMINLYPEKIEQEQGEPSQVACLPTPGTSFLLNSPNGYTNRGLFTASTGDLYGAWANDVYRVSSSLTYYEYIGSFTGSPLNPVKFADNGTYMLVCNGAGYEGYSMHLWNQQSWTRLGSSGWLGSTFLDYTDTYFVANYQNTPSFYVSGSESIEFDPLDFASKTSGPDAVVAAIVSHRSIWLIGKYTSTIYYNTGGGGLGTTIGGTAVNTFPFEMMPSVAIEDGCIATYSIAKCDTMIFWLATNKSGGIYVLQGGGDNAKRVSTHALEYQFEQYSDVTDAIGYCRVMNGHYYYVLTFQKANITWVYDIYMKLWFQWSTTDADGNYNRHLGQWYASAWGKEIVSDYRNGNLFYLNQNYYRDAEGPLSVSIKRYRSFPQIQDSNSNNRIYFKNFTALMSAGQNLYPDAYSYVRLLISDDGGQTFKRLPLQTLGATGKFRTNVNWWRLGMARNRVFALEWDSNAKVALQGAWTDVELGAT